MIRTSSVPVLHIIENKAKYKTVLVFYRWPSWIRFLIQIEVRRTMRQCLILSVYEFKCEQIFNHYLVYFKEHRSFPEAMQFAGKQTILLDN